jgi:hypothetical protein
VGFWLYSSVLNLSIAPLEHTNPLIVLSQANVDGPGTDSSTLPGH